MKIDADLTLFTKINSIQIIHLNVKHKTLKLVEDSIGESLCDFEFGDELLYTTLKAQSMKEIID